MKDVKVITPEDLGDGIVWNDQTQKYEAVSQVFFTEREATVDLMINGMQLLFREVANSNRTMVVTGVNYNNVWYGDAPDNEQATNPFTGQPISAPVPLDNLFLRKTDLDNKTVVVDGNGLVAVKIYKDLIVTHGVLTVDNQGRFVMKDALVALKQPSKRNIGQMNLMTADEYGSTTNSRHYRLSFNFYNAQPVIKAISLTLNRWNGGEHIEPVKWVDYGGQEVTPSGVTTKYDNDQLIINITDLNEFRNSNADLVFKHWDEYRDYDSNYNGFYDEVRQGLIGGRWSFNPTVDTSLVDYPDSDTYELLNSAFTFNVYG